MKHPELLLPSGSMGVLKTAVRYGADACYIGGDAYSLRAGAINFSRPEMEEAVGYAHEHGVRIHVAANILAHNEDLRTAEDYFRFLNDIRPDAILVADPGMFRMAQRYAPDVEIHISTQANNTNTETCRFWQEMGAARVVMARELSLREIKEIRDAVGDSLEIEAFIHGAMCISYSGRCLLSNYLTGRDANHGACSHPCRWEYTLMEEKDPQGGAAEERPGHLLEYAIEEKTRPGVYMPVQETERGTYIFNSKDLCMVDHLEDLYAAGVDSFKIEGRMKTALYVATAARTYHLAMKDYENDPEGYLGRKEDYRIQIGEGTTRDFTTGFFYGKPSEEAQIYNRSTYLKTATYMGQVEDYDGDAVINLSQKNKFSLGDELEIMKPNGADLKVIVKGIVNEDGISQESAPHPKQKLKVQLEYMGEERPEVGDIIRRIDL